MIWAVNIISRIHYFQYLNLFKRKFFALLINGIVILSILLLIAFAFRVNLVLCVILFLPFGFLLIWLVGTLLDSCSGMLNIVRPEWDNFPEYRHNWLENHYFAGREKIVDGMVGWFSHSKGGSLLLCGIRGVGKTALIYHSIWMWRNRTSRLSFGGRGCLKLFWDLWITLKNIVSEVFPFLIHSKVTIVPIDAGMIDWAGSNITGSELGLFDKPKDTRMATLSMLIRALHFSKIQSPNIRKEVDYLYKQSLSERADIEETSSLSRGTKAKIGLSLRGSSNTDDKTWLLSLSVILIIFLIFLCAIFVYPVPFSLVSSQLNKLFATPVYKAVGVSSLVVFVGMAFTYIRNSSSTRNETTRTSANTFDFLYAKLNDILDSETEMFVFVIDELDKVSDGKAGVFEIDRVMKNIKNLVNISNAKFIFIGDEQYSLAQFRPNDGMLEREADYHKNQYPLTSTYYSWKLFLPSASADEVKQFIASVMFLSNDEVAEFDRVWKIVCKGDNCLDCTNEKIVNLVYLVFFLYYETNGIFFKIKEVFRSFVEYSRFDNFFSWVTGIDSVPLLIWDKDLFGWSDYRRKAALGFVLNIAYKLNDVNRSEGYVHNHVLNENSIAFLREAVSKETCVDDYLKDKNNQSLVELTKKEILRSHLNTVDLLLSNISKNGGHIERLKISGDNSSNIKMLDIKVMPVIVGFTPIENELFLAYNNLIYRLVKIATPFGWDVDRLVQDMQSHNDRYGLVSFDLVNNARNTIEGVIKCIYEVDDDENIFSSDKFSFVNLSESKIRHPRTPVNQEELFELLTLITSANEDFDKSGAGRTSAFGILFGEIVMEKARVFLRSGSVWVNILGKDRKILPHLEELLLLGEFSLNKLKRFWETWVIDTFGFRTIVPGTLRITNVDEKIIKIFDQKPYMVELKRFRKSISEINFGFVSESDYWRVGLFLGCTDCSKIDAFSTGKFPLIHLYKEKSSLKVYYCRYLGGQYKQNDIIPEDLKEVFGISADGKISITLKRNSKYADIFVSNGLHEEIKIDSIQVRSTFWVGACLAVWGDSFDWVADIEDVVVKFGTGEQP